MNQTADLRKKQQIFTIIFFLIIIFYIGFILSRSLWQNYKITQDVKGLEETVDDLDDDNHRLKNLVLYLRTDSYKEKEARRKLMMKMPGEHVLALPDVELEEDQQDKVIEQIEKKQENEESNPALWLRYIFG